MPKILISANTDWFLYNYRRSLGNFLRSEGFDVVMVSPPGQYTPLLAGNGFSLRSWKLSRNGVLPWEELRSLISLYRLYHQEAPDIVHHHTLKPVLYGSIVARMARIPCIVNSITGRGYVFLSEDMLARALRKIVTPIFKTVLNDPGTAVILEHDFDRKFFIDSGFVSRERSWIIHGAGADPDIFHPTREKKGVPVVLMASRMLWDKGIGTFVEAAKIIKSKVDVCFVLVGKPDPGNPSSIDEAVLKGWKKDGIVEWWGWKRDMASVFQQCHIVTLPTKYGEGVPNSLIEAAACGKPLVASNIPGCLPIVQPGKNGLLVPPEDPSALADALLVLISDSSLRRKMGENSRRLFLEKFTYAKVHEVTLGIYNRLLETV